jgi:DNA-binding GntR family transcriptional regulator
MASPGAAPTRGEGVYARLRGDILAGHLQPGSRLPFAKLCARYGTSVGVLREGLSRLVEQGLVHAAHAVFPALPSVRCWRSILAATRTLRSTPANPGPA